MIKESKITVYNFDTNEIKAGSFVYVEGNTGIYKYKGYGFVLSVYGSSCEICIANQYKNPSDYEDMCEDNIIMTTQIITPEPVAKGKVKLILLPLPPIE